MTTSNKSFVIGISLVPNTSTQNTTKGDLETLTADNKLHFFGAANDAVVTETVVATLTGKTINGPDNTLTNIANASLSNSSITINGSSIALGGSATIKASTTSALIIGTGLSGTSFDGSAPVTIAIDSSVVTLTGSQVLTNKTITGAFTGGLTGNADTATSASGLVLSSNGQTVTFQGNPSASATYSIVTPAAAPTASTALVYNGSSFVWGQAGGWTVSSSLALTAGGTITISLTAGQQVFTVSSASGNVTLAGAAFGSSAPVNGASIRLIGTSDTNTVSLVKSDIAYGLMVNGDCTLVSGSVIEFQYINNRFWEIGRNF